MQSLKLVPFILTLLISLVFTGSETHAEEVQIQHNERILNAVYQDVAEDKSEPVFLLVHGTWATHQQELPTALQDLLIDEEYSSLKITLSLNISDRKTTQPCDGVITAGHEDNLDEIVAWHDWLKAKGYERIIVIAHSRGGAQVALLTHIIPELFDAQVLIAPMVFTEPKPESELPESDAVLKDVRVLYCESTSITGKAYRSFYSSTPKKHTPDLLTKASPKTFIYLGTEDKLTEEFLKYFKPENLPEGSQHWVIEDADHFFRDLHADEIIETLLEQI